MTESASTSGRETSNANATPNSASHSASQAIIRMMPPGGMPSASIMPNSGVRSKVAIRKALTMLKLTSSNSRA